MKRYVVTELRGYLTAGTKRTGLSTHVVDTQGCHRLMGSWRTEDYGGSTYRRAELVRKCARDLAARLNGDYIPPPPAPPKPKQVKVFRPVCPRCGRYEDPDAAYCKCGKNLYRREIGH